MPPSLDDLALSLLLHLGVELVHNVHSFPDGTLREEVHIYANPKHMTHVLGWISRQEPGPLIRAFEGPRPPF